MKGRPLSLGGKEGRRHGQPPNGAHGRAGGKGLGEQHCEASLGTETPALREQKWACGPVRTHLQDRDAGQRRGQYSH